MGEWGITYGGWLYGIGQESVLLNERNADGHYKIEAG